MTTEEVRLKIYQSYSNACSEFERRFCKEKENPFAVYNELHDKLFNETKTLRDSLVFREDRWKMGEFANELCTTFLISVFDIMNCESGYKFKNTPATFKVEFI